MEVTCEQAAAMTAARTRITATVASASLMANSRGGGAAAARIASPCAASQPPSWRCETMAGCACASRTCLSSPSTACWTWRTMPPPSPRGMRALAISLRTVCRTVPQDASRFVARPAKRPAPFGSEFGGNGRSPGFESTSPATFALYARGRRWRRGDVYDSGAGDNTLLRRSLGMRGRVFCEDSPASASISGAKAADRAERSARWRRVAGVPAGDV